MPDRLAEIRARLDAATPGPWRLIKPLSTASRNVLHNVVRDTIPNHSEEMGEYRGRWMDADLIAHAPDDIAWLLDEVERLEKRVRMYEVVKS
jgi:ubiquinone biosynthesis protein UbiJ